MHRNTLPQVLFALILSFAAVVGLLTGKDYGISLDEVLQRSIGAVNAVYINEKSGYLFISKEQLSRLAAENVENAENASRYTNGNSLQTFKDRDYGPVFELYLLAVEKAFRLTDKRDIYVARHIATHLIFLLSLIIFYRLLAGITKNHWVALAGSVALLLSPRIYTESFINSKDIPFLCAYLIGQYTLMRLLDHVTWQRAVWHGMASALAVSIRMPGIMLIALSVGMLAVDLLKTERLQTAWKNYALVLSVYLLTIVMVTIACWPFLWEAPLENFLFAYKNMSKFRWFGQVYFNGSWFFAHKNLPASYIPIWIAISTPLLYIAGIVSAFVLALMTLWKNNWRIYSTRDERNLLQLLGAALLPVSAVIVLGSTLYNSWRHLYFVYPCLLAAAVAALYLVHQQISRRSGYGKWILPVLTSASFIFTIGFMVQMHPYQYLYFNPLAGSEPEKRFEYDYWGLSAVEALQYALDKKTDSVYVYPLGFIDSYSRQMIAEDHRKRLYYTRDLQKADFVVAVHSSVRTAHLLDSLGVSPQQRIHQVQRRNRSLADIYQLR